MSRGSEAARVARERHEEAQGALAVALERLGGVRIRVRAAWDRGWLPDWLASAAMGQLDLAVREVVEAAGYLGEEWERREGEGWVRIDNG